jgi:hypothetical protein
MRTRSEVYTRRVSVVDIQNTRVYECYRYGNFRGLFGYVSGDRKGVSESQEGLRPANVPLEIGGQSVVIFGSSVGRAKTLRDNLKNQPSKKTPFHHRAPGVPQVRASARTWVFDSRAKPLLNLFMAKPSSHAAPATPRVTRKSRGFVVKQRRRAIRRAQRYAGSRLLLPVA